LTFYPPKKVGPPLIRVEKKFLGNWAYRVSKEPEFYRKTEFLGTWKIFQKIVFLRKNLWELLDAKFYTFLKSAQNFASIDTICTQF
jgi:hypothetical protein